MRKKFEINFEFIQKGFLITPSIYIDWESNFILYIGWLIFSIKIYLKKGNE